MERITVGDIVESVLRHVQDAKDIERFFEELKKRHLYKPYEECLRDKQVLPPTVTHDPS